LMQVVRVAREKRGNVVDSSARQMVRTCLVGLALALLLVGIVSGTILRHVVQIVPIIIGVGVLERRSAWASSAALALFVFWSVIVVLIWLFLLGVSRIANGHYTATEVAATFVMLGCSIVGIIASFRLGRPVGLGGRVFAFLLFAGLQFVAMWVSFLGPIAHR
jgi:hypothetical protein